ncbi:SixA phosphatase family protein [Falsiroseomonas sp. HC035]|uniref:SixA phosphatase family protein n=1 Tax=Falsiroseomonas sp. HC035 TaxID=3390999 RepID=UPI003D32048C
MQPVANPAAAWHGADNMRQLLLLRHAKSSWDDPRLSDHARPLNARGRRAAIGMGAAMRDLGLAPDIVLVSSARRTLQTLEALAPLEGPPLVEPMDDLYLAAWPSLLDVLRGVRETARSVLLIGHNPGLHDLAMALAGPAAMAAATPTTRRLAEGYPTATLSEFALALPWRRLEPGGARLLRLLSPADLPSTEPGDTPEMTA